MSDSGRQYGDCKHGNDKHRCMECRCDALEKSNDELRKELDYSQKICLQMQLAMESEQARRVQALEKALRELLDAPTDSKRWVAREQAERLLEVGSRITPTS